VNALPHLTGTESNESSLEEKEAIMYGIEIAETDHSVLVRLDKDILSRETIDRTIDRIKEGEDLDYSHVGYVSDEEQADLEAILNAMTDEDKEIVRTIYIADDGKRD
jgi:hypothetical protein